jgi:hypothetical protein
VGNSNEIGKVYQVIEKWVFFKLLFANPTDSSRGKYHNWRTPCKLLAYPQGYAYPRLRLKEIKREIMV